MSDRKTFSLCLADSVGRLVDSWWTGTKVSELEKVRVRGRQTSRDMDKKEVGGVIVTLHPIFLYFFIRRNGMKWNGRKRK